MELTRLDAFQQAKALVDEMSKAPVNSKGYTPDGWKAPSLHEKMNETLRVAEFLLGGTDATGSEV